MVKTTSILIRFMLLFLSLSTVISVFGLAIGAHPRIIIIFLLFLLMLLLLTMLLLEPIFAHIFRASGAPEIIGGASNSAAWITIQRTGPGLGLAG